MAQWGDAQDDEYFAAGASIAAIGILVLPFAVDLVVLPVTGIRDLWVFRGSWLF